jgi:uncharacterized protein
MDDASRDPAGHWPRIVDSFRRAQASSFHCTIASVDADGLPTITPIGTLFLREDCTGYFFDAHTSALGRNVARDARVCVAAVDARRGFWFRSLLLGRSIAPPGVRLYGTVNTARPATAAERAAVARRTRMTRGLRGHRLLWRHFESVRGIHFDAFRPVRYPAMMDGMWEGCTSEPAQ